MSKHTLYKSDKGIAEYWQKDGLWHVARPHVPTEAEREQFSASYPKGDNGPFYRWTNEEYPDRASAITAIEK